MPPVTRHRPFLTGALVRLLVFHASPVSDEVGPAATQNPAKSWRWQSSLSTLGDCQQHYRILQSRQRMNRIGNDQQVAGGAFPRHLASR